MEGERCDKMGMRVGMRRKYDHVKKTQKQDVTSQVTSVAGQPLAHLTSLSSENGLRTRGGGVLLE